MKINEFSLVRYGPLPERGRITLNDFNLLFGKNESGKTLTIDALVKLLLGRNIKQFKRIDRVDEKPEGYVIVLTDNNEKIKLKGAENLADIINVSSAECCNLFIIRDSDLSISNEGEFYSDVTDRLLGLRTKDLNKIEKNLREIGKITQTGMFRNIGDEKLKDKMDEALKNINNINELNEEIKNKSLDIIEEKSISCRDKIKNVKLKIGNFEKARIREKYEIGKEALDKIIEDIKKFKEFQVFNEINKEKWRDNESKIRNNIEQKESLIDDLSKKEIKIDEINQELREKEIDFKTPRDIKEELDKIKNQDLFEYEIKTGELANQSEKVKYFTYLLLISFILLSISLFGFLISITLSASIFTIIFGILCVGFILYKYQYIRAKAYLAGITNRTKFKLSKLGLESESIKGCLSNIQKFEVGYNKKSEELQSLLKDKESLLTEITQLRDVWIPSQDREIGKTENAINDLKEKSGVQSIQHYTNKLNLKQNYKNSIENQKVILNSHFPLKGETLEENILFWTKEIKKIEEFKDIAMGIKYNEEFVSNLKEEQDKLENDLKDIYTEITALHNKLREIERNTNDILRLGENYLYCTTTSDLNKVKEKLNTFLKENNNRQKYVLDVIKIFNEIESEEKEKISELLSKESSVSDYFKEITAGIYEAVIFEVDSGKIKVRRKDGLLLDAEKLSGGTYDQLYFSIRLALGEKLLKDKTGFFIMDDPFIKADSERLQNQIEMLKKISEFGWQIIYFTVKDEVKDLLNQDIEKGSINYIPLEGFLI